MLSPNKDKVSVYMVTSQLLSDPLYGWALVAACCSSSKSTYVYLLVCIVFLSKCFFYQVCANGFFTRLT